MMKPSPYVLPSGFLALCCGLLLCLPGTFCSAQYQIDLVPATTTVPAKLSVSMETKIPTNIRLEWQVLLNGLPGQKGLFPTVSLLPHRPTLLRLPLKLPADNQEVWLRV